FRPQRVARDPVLFAWRALCRGMLRSGIERRRNEGPMDFAARAADAFPQHADAIRAVSRDFVALRYAESGAEPAAVQAFSVAARRLRSTLRRQRVRRTEPVARPDG
ncbi:MAG TPA: DUF4129 domain-containing protein, partial [Xanthomonadales bacterium]|nr:DUF4129 domain-containing protein [Xanthomonadales bacterium]